MDSSTVRAAGSVIGSTPYLDVLGASSSASKTRIDDRPAISNFQLRRVQLTSTLSNSGASAAGGDPNPLPARFHSSPTGDDRSRYASVVRCVGTGRRNPSLQAGLADSRRRFISGRELGKVAFSWLALLTCLALAPRLEADSRTAEELALVAAGAADIISTELALQGSNVHEANPLGQSTTSRIAIKSGATAGMLLLARYMDSHGNPGAARIIRWSGIAAWGTAAGWNVSLTFRY